MNLKVTKVEICLELQPHENARDIWLNDRFNEPPYQIFWYWNNNDQLTIDWEPSK